MSRRTPAFVAVMLSVCAAGIVPHAALADAALSDPATLILSGGGPGADKPEKHLKFIAITPKGCTLRDTVFSPAGLKTDVYACHLLPGEAFPKREKNGLLAKVYNRLPMSADEICQVIQARMGDRRRELVRSGD